MDKPVDVPINTRWMRCRLSTLHPPSFPDILSGEEPGAVGAERSPTMLE